MTGPTDILLPQVISLLKAMEPVFRSFGVDYYLAGALARDVHLSAHEKFSAKRRTKDVDIAVLLDAEEKFYQIKEALVRTGDFEERVNKPIKLIYRGETEVDLLPFGEIENEDRELFLNRHALLVMDMSGFREVYPFVNTVEIESGVSLNVCSLEGLILLKLIAHHDNPSRTKDITDIEHLLKVYFELNSHEIYTDYFTVMEMYSTVTNNYLDLVSARVIGRKIGLMLKDYAKTGERIKAILSSRPVPAWLAMLDGMNES